MGGRSYKLNVLTCSLLVVFLADAMKCWLFFVAFLPGVCFAGNNGKKIVPLDQKYNQVVITCN